MKIKIASIVIFLSLAFAALSQDSISFQPKLKLGDRFVRLVETKISADINTSGKDSKQNQKETQEINIKQKLAMTVVELLENGYIETEVELLSLKINIDSKGINTTYDSDIETSSSTGKYSSMQSIKGVIGAKARFILTKTGKINSIGNVYKFNERVLLNTPYDIRYVVETLYNETSLKKIYNVFAFQNTPDKPIKIGETWNWTEEIPFITKDMLLMESSGKFTGWETFLDKKCAVIETSAIIKNKPDAKSMNFDIKSSDIKGKIFFFPEIGMSLDIESEQNIVYELKVKNKDGQSIMTKTKQNVKSRLLEFQAK